MKDENTGTSPRPDKIAQTLAPRIAEAPRARAPARPARWRLRHLGVTGSFLLLFLAPVAVSAFYLFVIARDQYASTVGFSVRREEASSAIEILGGITSLSGSTSSDTDVLFEFIRSQPMVEAVDLRLDLRRIYGVSGDPVFALESDPTIEDLTAYWRRMVKVFYDSGSGLIELRVHAFAPDDAQNVATAIFEESTALINQLSSIARDDATRYAKGELDRAVERLVGARQALTEYRARTQILDPAADIEGRMGLLATLETQLVEAQIDLDILNDTTRESDPRVEQAVRRVAVLEDRIAAERARFGMGDTRSGDGAYATLLAEYERLSVDAEFAEQAYLTALASYDVAVAEAQRQSRYLAAYVMPTRPQSAEYPARFILLAMIAVCAFVAWSILVLVYYSIRDRR